MKLTDVSDFLRQKLPRQKCGAVIVAAGTASRMGGIDKAMTPLGGVPVIVRTVQAFQAAETVDEIVIVTRADLIPQMQALCAVSKLKAVIVGGKSRQESVGLGLNALSKDCKLAAIHDGARPLISVSLIDKTVTAAKTYHAVAPAIPVKDTIKTVEGNLVTSTPDRSTLRAIQTPQVIDIDLLKGALHKAEKDNAVLTDDCSAVEYIGMKVTLIEGEERNLKITTPMDLKIAELFLEETT